jgi:hypothetical protein
MALGDGGLDAQVEQRMDAYRGNPQKLQQRYGQNKELLDLLALQKLTSEKKQVAADMQLKAQQNPNTIAQQREAEALELTKSAMGGSLSDLAGRTKGTLDQKNAMQQKNMQRMAQGASKPQMGGGAGLAGLMGKSRPNVPPQAQGLAGARMAQAANSGGPVRMAGGGIVAFAGGEGVSGQKGLFSKGRKLTLDEKAAFQKAFGGTADRLINQVEKGSVSSLSVGKDTQQQIADILGETVAPEAEKGVDPLRLANPGGLQNTGVPLSGALMPPSNATTQRPDDGSLDAPAGIQTLVPPVKEPMGGETLGQDSVQVNQTPPVEEKPVAGEGTPTTGSGIDMNTLMGNMGFTAEDPNAAMQRGFAESDAYTGRAEKAAKYDDMTSEMAAFDAENYDPDRERRDRLKSFLMGAAGTTNIGTTFASAGAASMNLANSQRRDRRSRLMDKFNMEKDKMTTDTGLAQSGLTLGRELYSQAQQNQRSALQAGVQLRGQDLTNAQKNADRILRKIEGDNTQAYRSATLAIEKNKVDLAALKDKNATEAARVTAANNTIFRTLQVREQIAKEANASAGVEVAKTELENAELMGLEPEQVAALQEKFDKAAALALSMTEDMMNKFGRGVGEDGKPTGTSLLDAEQFAIQVLSQYGIEPTIEKDSVTSTSYSE